MTQVCSQLTSSPIFRGWPRISPLKCLWRNVRHSHHRIWRPCGALYRSITFRTYGGKDGNFIIYFAANDDGLIALYGFIQGRRKNNKTNAKLPFPIPNYKHSDTEHSDTEHDVLLLYNGENVNKRWMRSTLIIVWYSGSRNSRVQ